MRNTVSYDSDSGKAGSLWKVIWDERNIEVPTSTLRIKVFQFNVYICIWFIFLYTQITRTARTIFMWHLRLIHICQLPLALTWLISLVGRKTRNYRLELRGWLHLGLSELHCLTHYVGLLLYSNPWPDNLNSQFWCSLKNSFIAYERGFELLHNSRQNEIEKPRPWRDDQRLMSDTMLLHFSKFLKIQKLPLLLV